MTEIEKTEAEETSLELENSDSYLENPEYLDTLDETSNEAVEETVSYTDPAGNTFEAPVVSFDTIDLNSNTKMAVVVSPCAAHDSEPGDEDWMDGIDESTEEKEEFQIAEDQEWTGENAHSASLEPTPEEHVQFEKETEDDFAFDFSDDEDDNEAFF